MSQIVPAADPATGTATRVALLDALGATPDATALRAHTYRLLGVTTGDLVLEIGCGSGQAVAELRALGCRAVGLDTDAEVAGLAAARWPDAEFRTADATALPFADGSVAGYRAEKVLHGLDDPAAALAEAHRVLAAGGRIVLTDQDWAAVTVPGLPPELAGLTPVIMAVRAETTPSPRFPEHSAAFLAAAGFTAVTRDVRALPITGPTGVRILTRAAETALEAQPAATLEPAAVAAWCAAVTARPDEVPAAALPMSTVAATRP